MRPRRLLSTYTRTALLDFKTFVSLRISQSSSHQAAEETGTTYGRAAEQASGQTEAELWRPSEYDHVGSVSLDFHGCRIFAFHAGVADDDSVDRCGGGLVGGSSAAADVIDGRAEIGSGEEMTKI